MIQIILSFLFASVISLHAFAEKKHKPIRSYNNVLWGPTELYNFEHSSVKLNTNFWLNKASVGEREFLPLDMMNDPKYDHSKNLKTSSCWFTEYDRNFDQVPGNVALQIDSKFFLVDKPYATRYTDYEEPIERLHFILEANYWGNPANIGQRRIHVTCDVEIQAIELNNMDQLIEDLLSPSFRTTK